MKKGLLWSCMALFSLQLTAGNYYVKSTVTQAAAGNSWASATTLDDALSKAIDGDEVHVAAGVYVPTIAPDPVDSVQQDVRMKTFTIVQNIKLTGGYPADAVTGSVANPSLSENETLLSGQLDNTNFAYHIMLVAASEVNGKQVEVSGFTFAGGRADNAKTKLGINGKTFMCSKGAAIVSSGSVLNLAKCIFGGNSSTEDGSAVFYYGGSGKVTNCLFDGNTSSKNYGALKIYAAKVDISDCTFEQNIALSGGAISVSGGSTSTISGSTFTNNRSTLTGNETSGAGGGAIYAEQSAQLTVDNCIFTGGKGFNGGFVGVNATKTGDSFLNVMIKKSTFSKSNIYDKNYEKDRLRGGVLFVDGKNIIGSLVTLQDCKMEECRANIGGVFYLTNKAKVVIERCDIDRPRASTQAPVVETNAEGTHLILKDCFIHDAVYGPDQSWNMMLCAAGNLSRIDAYNCLIMDNKARNIADDGVEQATQKKSGTCFSARSGGLINAVNCTMTNNQGRNIAFVAEEKAMANTKLRSSRANFVSCTIAYNLTDTMPDKTATEIITHANPVTAVAYFYNTIIAGNIAASTKNEAAYGRSKLSTSIYGADVLGANGQPIVVDLPFNVDFDLLPVEDNGGFTKTMEIAPNQSEDEINAASKFGMTKEQLTALATELDLDASLLIVDQRGVDRGGNKCVGAYSFGEAVNSEGMVTDKQEPCNVYAFGGSIVVRADKPSQVSIYSIDNRLLKNMLVAEGENTITGLATGCYIVVFEGKGIVVSL